MTSAPRIGVLGGGQLGRMLALAGYPLGFRFRFLDPSPDCPAADLAEVMSGDLADRDLLARFADGVDLVTLEWESVPLGALRFLEPRVAVSPGSRSLEAAQDRLAEKEAFQAVGIPTAPYRPVRTEQELCDVAPRLGYPLVLKARRAGYDGRGQRLIRGPSEHRGAWEALIGPADRCGAREPVAIAEAFVPFEREVSILAARGSTGLVFYPLVENRHVDGILRLSLAPAPHVPPELQAAAQGAAEKLLHHLDHVGLLAIEFFQVRDADGRPALWANEFAPRVHNSGHWTIEGAETSQFENHLRAILGQPLGPAHLVRPSAMVNLIGDLSPLPALLETPGAHVHLYRKEPKPGRKIGHVTVGSGCPDELARLTARVAALTGAPWP